MAEKSTVAVTIRGQEFRVRSDDGSESLQRVAAYLNETMSTVEKRTGTIDSLDLALLTGLNLARQIVRDREASAARGPASSEELEELTDLVEAALDAAPAPQA